MYGAELAAIRNEGIDSSNAVIQDEMRTYY
jgi:hypothetical protein